MQIKCKQIREGGTEITLGEVTYHFSPDSSGDHVAEVTDEAHIELLLNITEGFEEVELNPAAPAEGIAGMNKAALMALAGENGIELNPAAPVAALRKQLASLLAEKAL